MVQQQELHDAGLCLCGNSRRVLGADDHAIADDLSAGRLRLGHALDLNKARAAGCDRLQERVIAKARDLGTDELGGTNNQRALGNLDCHTVDDDGDGLDCCEIGAGVVRDGHRATAPAKT